MRVAFRFQQQGGWTAGLHYIKNLLAAVHAVDRAERPDVLLLTPDGTAADPDLCELTDLVVREPTPVRPLRTLDYWLELVSPRAPWLPRPEVRRLSALLERHAVDAVFLPGKVVIGLRRPMISWIPDFQHVHLPEFFSEAEVRARDAEFAAIAQHAAVVVLSSHAALADFKRFSPSHAAKGRVLRFVAQVPSTVYRDDPRSFLDGYQLPDRFAYLPNQFWAHKNHGVVVEALAQLRDSHPHIRIICTGNTADYRAPGYYDSLRDRIAQRRIADRLVVLGVVPREHVFHLMRQALFLLQPSRFEGWSTSIEEAKSLGKRQLVSDIRVHREQAEADTLFFDPADPDALAARLVELFDSIPPGPDPARESAARQALPERTARFGRAFVEAAEAAVR